MQKGIVRINLVVRGLLCFGLAYASAVVAQVSQQELVSCKPGNLKTSEIGCWILTSQALDALNGPIYWTLDVYPSKERAELAKGPGGSVVEALGKIWLFTVGEKIEPKGEAVRIRQIGPLPVHEGQKYTAQYMEATLQPGMVSKTHVHGGVEVFFTESGETCLETPEGKQLGHAGNDIVIPGGVPMELTATGKSTRRGIMLVLHESSKPATTVVESWKSKGLCRETK